MALGLVEFMAWSALQVGLWGTRWQLVGVLALVTELAVS